MILLQFWLGFELNIFQAFRAFEHIPNCCRYYSQLYNRLYSRKYAQSRAVIIIVFCLYRAESYDSNMILLFLLNFHCKRKKLLDNCYRFIYFQHNLVFIHSAIQKFCDFTLFFIVELFSATHTENRRCIFQNWKSIGYQSISINTATILQPGCHYMLDL